MSKIDKFVDKILKYSNVDIDNKKELKLELVDHINNVKEEFMENGISEEVAIKRAISEFDKSEFLRSLEINDKYYKFNILNFVKSNMILLLIYLVTSICGVLLFSSYIAHFEYLFIVTNFIISYSIYRISFVNFESKKNIVNNMIILDISFFTVSTLGIAIFLLVAGENPLNSYLFRSFNLLSYLLFSIIFFMIALKSKKTLISKIKIPFMETSILSMSIILILMYSVFPNRFFALQRLFSGIFNIAIESFEKNFLYMTINNDFIIINFGLVLLISVIIYKVIKSISRNLIIVR